VSFGLVRTKAGSAHPKYFIKFALPIFIGLMSILVGQSTVAPPANASVYGTIYNVAPKLSGGDKYGEGACPAGQVVVGLAMGWNPISYGFICKALNSDLSVSAITGKNANYVYCPDGKVAVGMAFINSNGIRAGLLCNTPPGMGDTEVETQFVSANNSPRAIDKPSGQAYFGGAAMRCNAGDIMVGWRVWSGAWLDGLAPRCAPFTKFTVTYNVNSGGGTAPATQQQSGPNASITLSSAYAGTRTGFTLSGWNTQANGLGTNYAAGATITPSANLVLYAKWLSTITYDGNTNTSGAVPNSTTAVSSAAITYLSPNDGSSASPNVPLAKTGFTFAGWNTLANGAGTSYPASSTGAVTETPYMLFDAENFNDTTNAWTDTSGNSRSIPGTAVSVSAGNIRGNPSKVTNVAGTNGASKEFPVVQGATTDGIVIGNGALTNYTFCHVARYAGTSKNRIFAGITGNWLSGFWGSATGVAYHEGWITASTGVNDTNWKIQCDTGGSRSSLRSNGTLKSSIANNATGLPANISINSQGSRNAPSEVSDWAVAYFVIYDSVLSESKIQEIEAGLNRKYGVGLFTSTIDTYNYASTGDKTLYAQWNSTITYNGNGQTSASSTVPAPTIAKGTAGNTTLANAGTMVRTGFAFAGWNTQADGLGTNYASGLTTYASTGNVTLYAKWVAVITYDSNGATGSASRSSDTLVNSVSPIAMSSLPTVGTMVRTGYTFAGWNTAANGSGTNYSPNLPATYMRFVASNFNDETNVWTDSSGNTRFISGTPVSSSAGNIRGNPTRVAATSGKGATGTFDVVKGMATTGSSTYGDGIIIGNESLPNFTLCYVARYAGATRGRLFAGVTGHWLSGFYGGYVGVAHPGAWITGLYDAPADDSYRVMCHTGGTASGFRSNGVNRTTVTNNTTVLPADITISSWGSRTQPSERTDWEVAEIVLYPQILNQFQLEAVEDTLRTTYGITNYTTPSTAASQVTFTPTGTTTLYARWIANGYTLAFDTSTATSGTMPSTWVTAGNAFTLPANALTRTGYSFKNY